VVKGGEDLKTTGPRQQLADSREGAAGSAIRSDLGLQGPTITRGDAAAESKSRSSDRDMIADTRTSASMTTEATNHTMAAVAAVRAGSIGGGTLTTLPVRLTGSTALRVKSHGTARTTKEGAVMEALNSSRRRKSGKKVTAAGRLLLTLTGIGTEAWRAVVALEVMQDRRRWEPRRAPRWRVITVPCKKETVAAVPAPLPG
jgi:hypothetical protein